jgi:hypothetical protein
MYRVSTEGNGKWWDTNNYTLATYSAICATISDGDYRYIWVESAESVGVFDYGDTLISQLIFKGENKKLITKFLGNFLASLEYADSVEIVGNGDDFLIVLYLEGESNEQIVRDFGAILHTAVVGAFYPIFR